MHSSEPYRNLSVAEVRDLLASGTPPRLIDVREPGEHAIARIEGAELMPLSTAREWVESLPRDEPLVFFCHHGGRSESVVSFLATQLGYTNTANMLGGIDAWSAEVDPRVPRY